MHARAVILPNIDGVLTFGCDPCARHIRRLTDFEQRQTVAGFQVTSLAIESNAEFDDGLLSFRKGLRTSRTFTTFASISLRRRSLAQIFAF
jgi:hypothetical protein